MRLCASHLRNTPSSATVRDVWGNPLAATAAEVFSSRTDRRKSCQQKRISIVISDGGFFDRLFKFERSWLFQAGGARVFGYLAAAAMDLGNEDRPRASRLGVLIGTPLIAMTAACIPSGPTHDDDQHPDNRPQLPTRYGKNCQNTDQTA